MHGLKRTLIALAAVAVLGTALADAQARSFKFTRRTMNLAAGSELLIFDAPKDMCFLDETKIVERTAMEALKTTLPKGEQILAAFANCLEIVNLGGQGGGIQNGGYISWYNPAIGDKTALSRQDYLDSLEPTFFEHVGKKANTHRTPTALAAGMIDDKEFLDGQKKTTIVHATTEINGVPLIMAIAFTKTKEAYPLDDAYAFMDKFVTAALFMNERPLNP